MKLKLLLTILILTTSIYSQHFPQYQERALLGVQDTAIKRQLLITASEGVINPDKYKLGPGDILFISISGVEEKIFTPIIDPEGFIYIPRIGAINLQNSSLIEAKKNIQQRLLKSFKDVEIHISLNSFRKIKVSLIGDVKSPSTYVLSSSSRLLDLFVLSTGLSNTSDIRNIKIISKNGEIKKYDLLKFLRLGDIEENPYLNDGDLIYVDKAERFISLFGQIKFTGNYEFKAGETVLEILEIAGGLSFKAREDSIEIVRFTDDGKFQYSTYYSFNQIKSNKILLKEGDFIIVREIPDYFDVHYVEVKGEVNYPGVYKIKKDETTLSQIIAEAGGFKETASLNESMLFRRVEDMLDPELERIKVIPRADMTEDEYDYLKARLRQQKGKIVVDFEKLFLQNIKKEDIVLKYGDVIIVPELNQYVEIIGQVVNPGKLKYYETYSVNDYIKMAGGFSWRALKNDVRVIRANTGEWVDAEDIDKLKPGDTIWVPEDPPGPKFWDVFTTSLQVIGQVATVVAATVAIIVSMR